MTRVLVELKKRVDPDDKVMACPKCLGGRLRCMEGEAGVWRCPLCRSEYVELESSEESE